MKPKVILLPIQGDQNNVAQKYAFRMASTYNAKVVGVHAIPNAMRMAAGFAALGANAPYYPFFDIDKLQKELMGRAGQLEQKFRQDAQTVNVKADFHISEEPVLDLLTGYGRLADLIVMSKDYESHTYGSPLNGVLLGTGRPVILVPQTPARADFKKVLIAWNGSREAAQAATAVMPYLVGCEVTVFTKKEKDYCVDRSASRLADYFESHGIEVRVLTQAMSEAPISEAIFEVAKKEDVDMVVMGAWGHTRVYEYIMGGATNYALHAADRPVFMVH